MVCDISIAPESYPCYRYDSSEEWLIGKFLYEKNVTSGVNTIKCTKSIYFQFTLKQATLSKRWDKGIHTILNIAGVLSLTGVILLRLSKSSSDWKGYLHKFLECKELQYTLITLPKQKKVLFKG